MRLYCEEPGQWHALHDNLGCYERTEIDEWLRELASPLNKPLTIIKYAAPYTIPALGLVAPGVHRLKDDVNQMQALLSELPGPIELPDNPLDLGQLVSKDLDRTGPDPARARSMAFSDADFRKIAAFLKLVDPDERWADLSRHTTPEGRAFQEHRAVRAAAACA